MKLIKLIYKKMETPARKHRRRSITNDVDMGNNDRDNNNRENNDIKDNGNFMDLFSNEDGTINDTDIEYDDMNHEDNMILIVARSLMLKEMTILMWDKLDVCKSFTILRRL